MTDITFRQPPHHPILDHPRVDLGEFPPVKGEGRIWTRARLRAAFDEYEKRFQHDRGFSDFVKYVLWLEPASAFAAAKRYGWKPPSKTSYASYDADTAPVQARPAMLSDGDIDSLRQLIDFKLQEIKGTKNETPLRKHYLAIDQKLARAKE